MSTTDEPQNWPVYLEEARCLGHMSDFDSECERCLGEVEALQRFQNKIHARNQAAEQRIAYLGKTVEMTGVLMMRLNTFIDVMLQNPKMRGRFEIMFATACEEALRHTEEAVNRQRLLEGIVLPGQR